MKNLKVGSRGSALALTQTHWVIAELKKKFPEAKIENVVIKTTGDKMTQMPLSKIGLKGLFTKEIEEALLDGKIDLAVHSLKDLTTEFPAGLKLGAVTEREDPRDCLIALKSVTLKTLPQGARVGTSSLRRQAQIAALRKDLKIENLRGNLDTRIRKLREGQYDAIVVARAGVKRLLNESQTRDWAIHEIPFDEMLPAVGQGSLAIEIRDGDEKVEAMIQVLNHRNSLHAAICERAFLRKLQGGCQIPAGAFCEVKGDAISVEGMIALPSGEKMIRYKMTGTLHSAETLGEQLGEKLLKSGGEKILTALRI